MYPILQLFDYFFVSVMLETDILELVARCWVLIRMGPPPPHILRRLTMSLSSVAGTVYRRLHTLPMVTVWLDCPRFGCFGLGFLGLHTHIHATRNYHMHDR